MKKQKITSAIGVELLVKPGTGRIYFDDIAQLRGKKIRYIDYFSNITAGKSGLATSTVEGVITLRSANTQNEIIEKLNLKELDLSITLGNRILFNHAFDLSKSYVDITDNSTLVDGSMYFVFYFNDKTNKIKLNCNKEFISSFEIPLKQSRTMLNNETKLTNCKFKNLFLSFPRETPSGETGINIFIAKRIFLTLQNGSDQFLQNVPIILFYQYSLLNQIDFDDIQIDFTNSFVDIVNPVAEDFKSVFFNCYVKN